MMAGWILPPGVTLRPAEQYDRGFAAELYLDSMRRHLTALGRWDEARAKARFRRVFSLEQSSVLCHDGHDIGWMQISESRECVYVHQIHIIERFRNQGIGSSLIRGLLDRSKGTQKTATLNVIRGNPAIVLYLRLGFRIIDATEERLRMVWEPPPGR